jgi:hypothetical protein
MTARFAAVVLLMVLFVEGHAWALWPAPIYDDELVQRSDAIVIGHVEASFTAFGPLEKNAVQMGLPADFRYLQYRTLLIVTKILVGKIGLGPTPLIIHYGLRPVVLKTQPTLADEFNPPAADSNTRPQTPVGIFDSTSDVIGIPPSDDIRKDHIWLLHTQGSSHGGIKEDTSAPGIWSPDDVQPIDRKAYYLAVISDDPEALTPYTLGDSWQAHQARMCQGRLEVQHFAKIADPELRADALVTFMASEEPFSSPAQLAMTKLEAMGPVGLQKLVPLFQNADHAYDRRAILQAWSRGRYQPAVPVLIDWLRSESQWWSQQSPKDMIWSFQEGQKGGTDFDDPRAASNRNVYCAVEALGNQGGAEGKAIIEQTRAQWNDLGVRPPPGNDIVSVCDDALAAGK